MYRLIRFHEFKEGAFKAQVEVRHQHYNALTLVELLVLVCRTDVATVRRKALRPGAISVDFFTPES